MRLPRIVTTAILGIWQLVIHMSTPLEHIDYEEVFWASSLKPKCNIAFLAIPNA